jgi:hypothetical protein
MRDGASRARRMLAVCARAEFAPVCAIVGGMVGREVIKVISRKDEPVCNWFAFDALTMAGIETLIPPGFATRPAAAGAAAAAAATEDVDEIIE